MVSEQSLSFGRNIVERNVRSFKQSQTRWTAP